MLHGAYRLTPKLNNINIEASYIPIGCSVSRMDMGRKDFWNGGQLQNAKRSSIVNDSDPDWYISQCNTGRRMNGLLMGWVTEWSKQIKQRDQLWGQANITYQSPGLKP